MASRAQGRHRAGDAVLASIAATGRAPKVRSIGPDRYERLLAWAAVALLVTALAAIARGEPEWARVPGVVWLHLATVLAAVALTPVMLLRRRGDRRHRVLGRVWVLAMLATAISSLFVRLSHPGHFSVIHLLSVYVIVQAPIVWWSAATHRIALHRGSVRGMVTGALLIAGFFTFPFGRLLGHWLFG
jgi:uncharacterized membrane protein